MIKKTSPEKWDCAKCQGRNYRCLLYDDPFEVTVPARAEYGKYKVRSVADIPGMLCFARQNPAHADKPDFAIFLDLGVCPIPTITPLSSELLKLYNHTEASGDFRIVDGMYYDQPAFYMAAMNLIAVEKAQVRAEQGDSDD